MAKLPNMCLLFTSFLLLLAVLVDAVPTPQSQKPEAASEFWMGAIEHQGKSAFGGDDYQVFRNVKEFGAKGKSIAWILAVAVAVAVADWRPI